MKYENRIKKYENEVKPKSKDQVVPRETLISINGFPYWIKAGTMVTGETPLKFAMGESK